MYLCLKKELELTSLYSIEDIDCEATLFFYDQSHLGSDPVRFKQILARISQRFVNHPMLKCRIRKSYMPFSPLHWDEDPRFNLEHHIRHVALPKPGDWRQFCILIARLQSRPIDIKRSLWEIYVIEGLDNVAHLPRGSFAIFCRMHPALADCSDNMWFQRELHDEEGERASVVPQPIHADTFDKALLNRLLDKVFRYVLFAPINFTGKLNKVLIYGVLPELTFLYRGLAGANRTPYTRFNLQASKNLCWAAALVSERDVQAICDAIPGATQRRVMLSIISRALRHYLDDKRELSTFELKMIVQSKQSDPCNIGGPSMYEMSMTTQIQDCREALVATVEADCAVVDIGFQYYIDSIESIKIFTYSNLVEWFEKLLDMKNLKKLISYPLANVFVTWNEVEGRERQLCGAQLLGFLKVSKIDSGLGLMHSVCVFKDHYQVSVTSCRELLPDPGFYMKCIQKSCLDHLDMAKDHQKIAEQMI